MDNVEQRARFEAWAKANEFSITRVINSGYWGRDTESAWAAWQAAIASQAQVPVLAKDHDGMRVSYSGLLRQVRGALTRAEAAPDLAEMLRQLEKHLEELGKRWYGGDALVVDELLQLYCIQPSARAALKSAAPAQEVSND